MSTRELHQGNMFDPPEYNEDVGFFSRYGVITQLSRYNPGLRGKITQVFPG